MRAALYAAVHDDVDPVPDRVHDLRQLVERTARAVQLASAVIGNDDAGAAYVDGAFRVLDRHDAFQAELPVPEFHHFGDVIPVHARVEHLGEIAADGLGAAAHVDVIVELRQPEPFVGHVVDRPHGLEHELEDAARGQPQGNREPGPQIAFAIAAGDAVDGQHENVHAGVPCPLEHDLVQALVLVKVELIGLRRIVFRAHLLEADGSERRHAEHGAEPRGGGRDGPFAVMVEQSLKRGRGAVDGHVQLLAHHRHRHVDLLHAGEHAGHQVDIVERGGVPPVGHLVVRGAVDVVEDRARQSPPGEFPEVMEIVALVESHRSHVPVAVN